MLGAALAIADLLPVDFELPDDLIATEPVEAAGGRRQDARLMVAWRSDDRLVHTTFADLGDVPRRRATCWWSTPRPPCPRPSRSRRRRRPARPPVDRAARAGCGWSSCACRDGRRQPALLRRPAPAAPSTFPAAASVELLAPYPAGGAAPSTTPAAAVVRRPASRAVAACRRVPAYLAEFGRPIRYGYARPAVPPVRLPDGVRPEPGSAEMPSAGAAVHHRPGDRPGQPGRGDHPDRAAHRRLVGRAGGAALPRALPGAGRRRPTRVNAAHRRRPPGHRRGHDRHPGPGDGGRRAGHRPPGRRMDRAGRHARAGGAGRRRPLTGWHQPAGSHLLLVEAVGGTGGGRAQLRRRGRGSATAGTSSATCTCSCPDRARSYMAGVNFRLEQRFAAPVEEVEAAFVDPDLFANLRGNDDLGRPEFIDRSDDGDTVRQRVRYAFTGELTPAPRRPSSSRDRLTWVEESDARPGHPPHRVPHRRRPLPRPAEVRGHGRAPRRRRRRDPRLAEGRPRRAGSPSSAARSSRTVVDGLTDQAATQDRMVGEWLVSRRQAEA